MYLGGLRTTVQPIILLIKGTQCLHTRSTLSKIKMTDSQHIVYVVLDWETKQVKGVYPDRQYAADAAFCLHSENDDEGTQTTIITTTMYEDASPQIEREQILREEAESTIAVQDIIPPLAPEGGEPT